MRLKEAVEQEGWLLVRKVNTKYGAWLAGYYDDFLGARAIPDDRNTPSKSADYDHTNSHHGNPMNGEATLNPRFRWANCERAHTSGIVYFTGLNNKLLRNKGLFEWLSWDSIRNRPDDWEGRAQIQYPDGHIPNRGRFNNAAGSSYQLISNGYNTNSNYFIPSGDIDATFGRVTIENWSNNNLNNKISGGINYNTTEIKSGAFFTQRAHLTGIWAGECFPFSTDEHNKNMFAPVRTASGKPFLVVQSNRTTYNAQNDKPTIVYDGDLNSRLDNDVFTARVCVRSFNGSDFAHPMDSSTNKSHIYPSLEFRIGYAKPADPMLTESGFSGTPAIQYTHDFYTGGGANLDYDFYGAKYLDNNTKVDIKTEDMWIDFEFVINYTTGKYRVFINGVEDKANVYNLAGSPTAGSLYGWEMDLRPQFFTAGQRDDGVNASYAPKQTTQYLMLDRVGLVHHLNDSPIFDNPDDTTIHSLEVTLPANGISNARLKLFDDAQYEANTDSFGKQTSSYYLNLKKVLTEGNDWELLVFGDENSSHVDRPIWRGVLSNLKIKQKNNQGREIEISAEDRISMLGKQIPLWEVGQKATSDEGDTSAYWLYDAKGFGKIMNFGARELEMLSNKLGFDVDDGYQEQSDQRTQMGASHPIQMYNNEDENGPNYVERYYDGKGIIGFSQEYVSNTLNTILYFNTTSGYSAGDNITIKHSGFHDGTYAIASVDNTRNTVNILASNLAYSPETAKIIMLTNYVVEPNFDFEEWGSTYDSTTGQYGKNVWDWNVNERQHPNTNDATSDFMTVVFDSDPGLKIGDDFYITAEKKSSNSASEFTAPVGVKHVKHTVREIVSGRNYYLQNRVGYSPALSHSTAFNESGDYSWNHKWYIVRTFSEVANPELPQHTGDNGTATGTSFHVDKITENLTPVANSGDDRFKLNGTSTVIAKIDVGDYLYQMSGQNETWGAIVVEKIGTTQIRVENQWKPGGATNSQAFNIRRSRPLRQIGSPTQNNNVWSYDKDDRWTWCKDTGFTTPNTTGTTAAHKAIHATWMRDLPHSLWFQYHFGQINKNPVNSCDEFVSNTGLAWTKINPTEQSNNGITTSTTQVPIPQHTFNELIAAGKSSGVAEMISTDSNGNVGIPFRFIFRGLGIETTTTTGGSLTTSIGYNTHKYYLQDCMYISQKIPTTHNHYIRIENFSNDYKHLWLLWSDMRNNGKANAANNTRKVNFGFAHPLMDNYTVKLAFIDQVNDEGFAEVFTELKIGEDIGMWNIDPSTDPTTGMPFHTPVDWDAATKNVTMQYQGNNNYQFTLPTGVLKSGDTFTLRNLHPGTQLEGKTFTITTGTNAIVNHGNGSSTVYGTLTTPPMARPSGTNTADNYGGTTISKDGGTIVGKIVGTPLLDSKYQNWGDKGGSLVIIDSSRFFNLNTGSNGGMSGRDAGGETKLEDFVATIRGYPALIDNYWNQILTTSKNTGDIFSNHPNELKLINDSARVNGNIYVGDTSIQLESTEEFGDAGYGIIQALGDEATKASIPQKFFFHWGCKNPTEREAHIHNTANHSSSNEFLVQSGTGFTNGPTASTWETWGIKAGMVCQSSYNGLYYTVTRVISNTSLKLHRIPRGYTELVEGGDIDANLGPENTGESLTFSPQLGKVYLTSLAESEAGSQQRIETIDNSIPSTLRLTFNSDNLADISENANTTAGGSNKHAGFYFLYEDTTFKDVRDWWSAYYAETENTYLGTGDWRNSLNGGTGHNASLLNSYLFNKKRLTFIYRKTGNQGDIDTGWQNTKFKTTEQYGWYGWPRTRTQLGDGPVIINVLKDKDGNSTENTGVLIAFTNGYNADTVTTFSVDTVNPTTQFTQGEKVYVEAGDSSIVEVGTIQSMTGTTITLTANNLVALPNNTQLRRNIRESKENTASILHKLINDNYSDIFSATLNANQVVITRKNPDLYDTHNDPGDFIPFKLGVSDYGDPDDEYGTYGAGLEVTLAGVGNVIGFTVGIPSENNKVQIGGITYQQEIARLYTQSILAQVSDTAEGDVGYGSEVEIHKNNYPTVSAHNSVAPDFALRMMMFIGGQVEDRNIGTFYDNDKFRVMWNAGLMKSWLPPTNIATPMDINNVPITRNMTTDGTTTNSDSFGGIIDSRGKNIYNTIKDIHKSSGVGINNTINTFSFQLGRDGRVDFRPKFNSGLIMNRDSLMVSEMDSSITSKISHVRVYYNDNASFYDHPTTSMEDTTKWKIFKFPAIKNAKEAQAIAESEYATLQNSTLSIRARPKLDINEKDKMIHKGRYGYLADPYLANQGVNDTDDSTDHFNSHQWTRIGTGGAFINGMVNALDGRQNQGDDSHRYGSSDRPHAVNDVNATDYTENFFFYGANSLSYALQVVHIPNGAPLSDDDENDLRVIISLKNGQGTFANDSATDADIEAAEFTVHLFQFTFSNGNTGDARARRKGATQVAHTSVNVKGSGFYEIEMPNYAGKNMVISVNAEYLRALLRHRCGNPNQSNILKNAHSIPNTGGSSLSLDTGNDDSIFPLGIRHWTTQSNGMYSGLRSFYYAPRIHVCQDLAYWPGTFIKYTDAGLGLDNETLTIEQVKWQVKAGQEPIISLLLEKDLSFRAKNILGSILPGGPDYGETSHSIGAYVTPSQEPSDNAGANTLPGAGTNPPNAPPSFSYTEEDQNVSQAINQQGFQHQIPNDGGSNVGGGYNDNTGQGSGHNSGGSTINQIGSGAYANIRGHGDMLMDNISSQGQWSILGQRKPAPTPKSIRGADAPIDMKPVGGTACNTDDGYSLPGKGTSSSEGGYQDNNAISGEIIIPPDIMGDEIELWGEVSHAIGSLDNTNATITTTITCNGIQDSHTQTIRSNTSNSRVSLLPRRNLSGLATSGNRVKIRVERTSHSSNDSDYSSVIIHNVNVGLNRAVSTAPNATNSFVANQ